MKFHRPGRVAVLNIVGLTPRLLPHMPRLQKAVQDGGLMRVKPVLPAVTCTVQSTYLTGLPPSAHGAVANGWYHRELAEHHFWKQSNHLVQGRKIWEKMRREQPGFTCANLFWWYNMYSSVEYSITPRPMYPADGRKIFDIYTFPSVIREDIQRKLGPFPFPSFWGPTAGIESSDWIARSARWINEHYQPDLSLVYLPHLDYNLQRLGPDDPAIAQDCAAIDDVAGRLLDYYAALNIRTVVLSEYGITAVNRPIPINRLFRAEGWITVKEELGRELLDCGASKVFAITDHQVAHIYVNEPHLVDAVQAVLKDVDGIAYVLDAEGKRAAGLDHERSGDLVAFATEDAWFHYYYWEDDALAPDFARCVDIHRKYGYDPAELFFDPAIIAPKLRAAATLLKRKLGFRALMQLIPLEPSLVKGSHGACPANSADWPVLIGLGESSEPITAINVHERIFEWVRRQRARP